MESNFRAGDFTSWRHRWEWLEGEGGWRGSRRHRWWTIPDVLKYRLHLRNPDRTGGVEEIDAAALRMGRGDRSKKKDDERCARLAGAWRWYYT